MPTNYQEGTWFAVPLDGHGYGVGIVARASRRRQFILGYYFAPLLKTRPQLDSLAQLRAADAVLIAHCGDLEIVRGRWDVLGRKPGWQRGDWPVPLFWRYEELTGRTLVIEYDDADAFELAREYPADASVTESLPRDRQYGPRAVESVLEAILVRGEVVD